MKHRPATPAQHAALLLAGWQEDDDGDYWLAVGNWILAPGGLTSSRFSDRHPSKWTLRCLLPHIDITRGDPRRLIVAYQKLTR